MKKYILMTIIISVLLNLKQSFERGYWLQGGIYPVGGEGLLILGTILIILALKQKGEFLSILNILKK